MTAEGENRMISQCLYIRNLANITWINYRIKFCSFDKASVK